MTDENTTGEQGNTSQQPEINLKDYVKKERYTGLVQKVETLTGSLNDAQKALSDKDIAIATLQSQFENAQGESETALKAKEVELTTLSTSLAEQAEKLAVLEAMKLKISVAREMGRSDLMPILDHVPDSTDPEQVKSSLAAFAKLADDAAASREKQLRSGITDTPHETKSAGPTTQAAWLAHIQEMTIGTPEREKALKDYGAFMRSQE